MKSPILGSSYVARSVNAANARMVNLFPEIIPEGGKEAAFLNRAPGLVNLNAFGLGTGPIRGLWTVASLLYVVSGDQFFQVSPGYSATLLGTLANDGNPVSMSDNGFQIFIACNGPSYIYNITTNVFAQISDPSFPGAVTVGFISGRFVFNPPIGVFPFNQQIWCTTAKDGSIIGEDLPFRSAETSPDAVVGLIVNHDEIWIFGTNTTEVWYDAGAPTFPFQPIQGAVSEIGCASPYTIAKMDNSVFWLSSDARGHGVVYRASGYSGVRVSTHAVEWQIQQYGDLSNAVAYTYQQDGHAFYVLVFPNQNTTWVYDVSTQVWHERCGFNNGSFTRHRGNCQAFFSNSIVIGDYKNSNLYAFDLNTYDDDGVVQKWLRSWRALDAGKNDLKRVAHHSLQLDCETGVGLNVGQGIDPQVMLRWSDDGGHTWSNEHWVSMGKIGVYYQRAIWRRLGMTLKLRDRVYEVSGTDPVKIAIMGAEIVMSSTSA